MPPISRKLLFVLFLIVCSNLVFAQSDKAQRRIDSLRQDIQTLEQKNDTGVVWSYIRLGLSLRNENYDTSIFYFKKGVEASERLGRISLQICVGCYSKASPQPQDAIQSFK